MLTSDTLLRNVTLHNASNLRIAHKHRTPQHVMFAAIEKIKCHKPRGETLYVRPPPKRGKIE